jgi:phosphoribosyl 1,2-cyclic phosphodiesterase
MRFASLGSGSRGNAAVVEAGDTRLLVDCGFSLSELERRLAGLGLAAEALDAVLVTHEHGDHLRGVAALARRHRLEVWMTPGTCGGGGCGELPGLRLFNCHDGVFRVGGVAVQPFAVPHDAREPCQFVLCHGRSRLGMLTDAGTVTPHILERLDGCDALVLECNHDPDMLARGPYPPSLQRRVGGAFGHLSNPQAAALLADLDHARLRHLLVAHVSEKNNHPDKARGALLEAVPGIEPRLQLADQDRPGPWMDL